MTLAYLLRLHGGKNFIGNREQLICNTFSYLKPVERSENGRDTIRVNQRF